jgi:hypothetical protein
MWELTLKIMGVRGGEHRGEKWHNVCTYEYRKKIMGATT